MQCEEFEDRLNAVLDERRRPESDAELSLHSESCPQCRRVAAAYGRLLDGFYALTTPQAANDLAQRILVELRPAISPRRRLAVVTASLAAAAGLVIAIGPLMRSDFVDRSPNATLETVSVNTASIKAATTKSSTAANASNPGMRKALGNLDVTLLPIVPELLALRTAGEDPYAGLAKETGAGLATVVLYVPGIGGAKEVEVIDNDDDSAWSAQMSEGLKPITESVAVTVDLLLRAIPLLASN